MTKSQRVEYLQQLILEDPADPFPHYGLVLELASEDPDLGKERWKNLLRHFPQYLPSYQLAGQVFFDSGDVVKALEIWKMGAELAVIQKNANARSELMSSIQNAMLED